MLLTLSMFCYPEQLLLGIPVNLLVLFSPSGSLAEFRPSPWLFRTWLFDGAGPQPSLFQFKILIVQLFWKSGYWSYNS